MIGRINLKFDSNQNHNQLILLYYFESKIKINLPYLIRNQKSKIKIKIRIKNHKNLKVKTSKNFFVFCNLIGKIGIEKQLKLNNAEKFIIPHISIVLTALIDRLHEEVMTHL